ncbi:hypothetical protein ARMGADRAFT_1037361 [Armillaria gallica]|uniref:Uncharacterized protein n=1 Tax=Armillaria gallica TaxID=47427 RepID=A0A2H3CMI7_ARMGA|nr:hypothetical protein ARMGADRAFT_1037361 [Armillaria gallica]
MSDPVEHREQPPAPVVSTTNTSMPSEVPTSDLEELHDYFKTRGLIDIPRLLQSYQDQDQTQLQVNDLMEKNQLLTLAMPSGSGDKKATLTRVQYKYITQFSKYCVSTIDPWVNASEIFQAQESIDNGLVLSPERYASPESEKNALYAEVYAILKPEHAVLFKRNYGPAKQRFIKCASDGHSTFVGCIKHDCFHTVFGTMVPSASEQGFDTFEDLTCQQLLGYDTEKKVYTSLPPILWPDGVRGIDNRFLFRSETLMKILTVTLFGSASLREGKAIKKKPTNGILWGMNEVTPGAIAFAAIMAHFVLSGNERFNEHGARSHIHYTADFKLYKSTIIKYLDKRHMKDTVTAFNRFVFKDWSLDHNSQRAEEGEIIEIPNDFSDSSGSDEESFEAQGVNVQSNSELTPTPSPSNVTVEELVDSVGAVTLGNISPDIDEQIQVANEIGTGRGQRNKWRGQGKARGAALVSQHKAPPAPTHRSNHTTRQTDEDEGIEEDDIYG